MKRRELKDKLRKYSELTPSIKQFLKYEHLSDKNEAIITIKINDNSQLYNDFSWGKQVMIDHDIIDYIDNRAHMIPMEYPVRLSFIGDFQEEDRIKIKDVIYQHYFLVLQDKKVDLHMNVMAMIALFIIGIVLIILWFTLEALKKAHLFSEVISIIGTFSLWEVADYYLLRRAAIKREYIHAGRLATAEIDFLDPSEATKFL